MDHQKKLFDAEASAEAKKVGMKLAEEKATDLELAREIAHELCCLHGETDADEVGKRLFQRHGIKSLGPAAGSIFKDGRFEFTGRRRRSERKTNHARELKVWKLRA